MKNQIDCIIIGGGIAGLQAAIQLSRYHHTIYVIDSGEGRSTLAKAYSNILGFPNGISGEQFRVIGQEQAEKNGVIFVHDQVIHISKNEQHFVMETKNQKNYTATTIFLSTGVKDYFPSIKHFRTCLGSSIYICPDCDGYEIQNKQTIVFGNGDTGAHMAIALTYWTNQLIYINHLKSEIKPELRLKLQESQITYIEEEVKEVLLNSEGEIAGAKLVSGKNIAADKGFSAFSGKKINNDLAKQLQVTLDEKTEHIIVNPRTKETNIPGAWAGGDVTLHSEQVTVAMGDGMQAAIWIHKYLQKNAKRHT